MRRGGSVENVLCFSVMSPGGSIGKVAEISGRWTWDSVEISLSYFSPAKLRRKFAGHAV